MHRYYYKSKIGILKIEASERGITRIEFYESAGTNTNEQSPIIKKCIAELDEYFEGRRTVFSVPLVINGTSFQKQVWDEMKKVPQGKTVTYCQIARALGKPSASRAVGGACRSNRIPIIIPCHRVIGSDGRLTGFGGKEGIDTKRKLLQHEGLNIPK